MTQSLVIKHAGSNLTPTPYVLAEIVRTMSVESPCVRNCCLDKKDVCLGCGRTVEEIIRWSDAGDDKKLKILVAAEKRKGDKKGGGEDI